MDIETIIGIYMLTIQSLMAVFFYGFNKEADHKKSIIFISPLLLPFAFLADLATTSLNVLKNIIRNRKMVKRI